MDAPAVCTLNLIYRLIYFYAPITMRQVLAQQLSLAVNLFRGSLHAGLAPPKNLPYLFPSNPSLLNP